MSTVEQARAYRARKRAERVAAGEWIAPRPHTPETIRITIARRSHRDENGCLIWDGPINRRTGYGIIGWGGKVTRTHRAAWIAAHGPVADGLDVCHSCDVRACVELSHLWLGTRRDNMQDAKAKGRNCNSAGWNLGRAHSPETRAKIAAKAKGRVMSPEHKAKIAESVRRTKQAQRSIRNVT